MFNQYLESLNETVALYLVIPFILFVGLYLSFRIGFIQFSKMKLGFTSLLKKDKNSKGDISHFEAICAVLAGNLGTGNIFGIAVALKCSIRGGRLDSCGSLFSCHVPMQYDRCHWTIRLSHPRNKEIFC